MKYDHAARVSVVESLERASHAVSDCPNIDLNHVEIRAEATATVSLSAKTRFAFENRDHVGLRVARGEETLSSIAFGSGY